MKGESWIHELRPSRWAQLCVVNLRILIGFAVLPAGLKKLCGEPFTDPDKVGVFHEFLHAFYAAKPLYFLVGALQVTAAFLLMTQRFATLGALLPLPGPCGDQRPLLEQHRASDYHRREPNDVGNVGTAAVGPGKMAGLVLCW